MTGDDVTWLIEDHRRRQKWVEARDESQKNELLQALVNHYGNITKAAKALRLARSHVNRLLDKYELRALAAEMRVRTQGTAFGRPWQKSENGRTKK